MQDINDGTHAASFFFLCCPVYHEGRAKSSPTAPSLRPAPSPSAASSCSLRCVTHTTGIAAHWVATQLSYGKLRRVRNEEGFLGAPSRRAHKYPLRLERHLELVVLLASQLLSRGRTTSKRGPVRGHQNLPTRLTQSFGQKLLE